MRMELPFSETTKIERRTALRGMSQITHTLKEKDRWLQTLDSVRTVVYGFYYNSYLYIIQPILLANVLKRCES